ncbi:MAG TPA: AbrB/MazE/SpoVT family DNA-binding domain-containing protein [Caulobacteraceae bacterium]
MPLAEDAAHFVHADASVADNIRALAAAGYSRAEIARVLHKSYQHVRNVLEGDKLKRGAQSSVEISEKIDVESLPDGGVRLGNFFRLPIGPGGVVRLPKEVMALGYREGGVLLADLEGDRFVIISPAESLRRARAKIAPWKPGEPLASDELIAERRREAAKEEEETQAYLKGDDG